MERVDALSVIVVTHNSERLLPTLAGALPEALTGVTDHEILIVDSGSGDSTVASASREFPDAQVIDLGWNAGYAAAINRALGCRSLTGPVLILNPDTRPGPGSAARLVGGLGPGVGITVPRLIDTGGSTAKSLRRTPTILRAFGEAVLGGARAGQWDQLGEVVQGADAYEREGTFPWATGAALCISVACIEAVGPWDESFFLYSEETDFALRAGDNGFTLRYLPTAEVFHASGEAMSAPSLFALLTVNRVHAFRKRHGVVPTLCFRIGVALNSALRAAKGSSQHRTALSALCRPRRAAIAAARRRESSRR